MLKIKSTVHPPERLPFNKWISSIMTRTEGLEHIQSPVIRDRCRQRIEDERRRYHGGK